MCNQRFRFEHAVKVCATCGRPSRHMGMGKWKGVCMGCYLRLKKKEAKDAPAQAEPAGNEAEKVI